MKIFKVTFLLLFLIMFKPYLKSQIKSNTINQNNSKQSTIQVGNNNTSVIHVNNYSLQQKSIKAALNFSINAIDTCEGNVIIDFKVTNTSEATALLDRVDIIVKSIKVLKAGGGFTLGHKDFSYMYDTFIYSKKGITSVNISQEVSYTKPDRFGISLFVKDTTKDVFDSFKFYIAELKFKIHYNGNIYETPLYSLFLKNETFEQFAIKSKYFLLNSSFSKEISTYNYEVLKSVKSRKNIIGILLPNLLVDIK